MSTEAATDTRSTGDDRSSAPAEPQDQETPIVRLDVFEGPLDVLLDRARTHRVDLSRISLATLIDQFVTAAETVGARASLSRRGDWLVMVAWLVLLKSRLLLPVEAPERREAEDAAEALRRQVLAREQIQRAASWLEARPRLGRETFPRGLPESRPSRRQTGTAPLLEACLTVLIQSERRLEAQRPTVLLRFWTVQHAMARLTALLPASPEGSPLLNYLPDPAALAEARVPWTDDPTRQQRGAVASTLLAGLELAKQGQLRIEQPEEGGNISVSRNIMCADQCLEAVSAAS